MKDMQSTNESKQKPLVSVIVPIYNVEQYLRRCIDSVLAQTYTNYELILVDDGSPDACGKICDEYAARNPKIKVIHQKNQGLSAARNNAVPKSNGEYITFIDSDDFVSKDYLQYLVSLIQKYDAQISAGGFVYQYENRELKQPKDETETVFFSPEDALENMNYAKGFGLTAWGKLYERHLIEANPYPIGKLFEDIATTYKIVGGSTGVAYGNKQIYYWLQRSNSIMRSSFNPRQLDGIEAAQKQLDYILDRYPKAVPAAKYRLTSKAVELTGTMFASGGDKKIFKELRSCMKKYAGEVLRNPKTKRSMKIRIFAMQLGYYPAKITFGIHETLKRKIL